MALEKGFGRYKALQYFNSVWANSFLLKKGREELTGEHISNVSTNSTF